MKYGKQQMMLIRKRIRVETWLEEQIEELFDGDDVSACCVCQLCFGRSAAGGSGGCVAGGAVVRADPFITLPKVVRVFMGLYSSRPTGCANEPYKGHNDNMQRYVNSRR
jgi:hypothetical protein